MTDYTFILGDSLFFPKKYHQIARDRVLHFDFERKLKTTMFASTKCRLNPHLRENFLLFTKKKKEKKNAYLPSQILNLKKGEPSN